MNTYAILEFEEGSMALTIGGQVDGNTRIFSCDRFPLVEVNAETVSGAMRVLGSDPLRGAKGVHVVVGDRRATHFVTTVPRMTQSEVGEYVTREAVRLASVSEANDLLVAPRLVDVSYDGRLQIAASALPRNVWDRVEKACDAAGLDVLGVHTTESCMALAAPAQVENAAVLELSGGRARFVYCSRNAPVQVRRFILGNGGDAGSMALAAQLAIELPRTFDWLREAGHDEPKSMILGRRLGLDDDSLEMLRGDLDELGYAEGEWQPVEGDAEPGLASVQLMQRLFRGTAPSSLLDVVEIRVPWSGRRVLALAATALVGVALMVHGLLDGRAYLDSMDQAARIELANDAVEREVMRVEALAAPAGETAFVDPQLQVALSMRRPVSRLVAEVSNLAIDEVHLESMQFASTEKVQFVGSVEGSSRQEALRILSQFVSGLRELPYMETEMGDEVHEVPGMPNLLRFQITFSWRNS